MFRKWKTLLKLQEGNFHEVLHKFNVKKITITDTVPPKLIKIIASIISKLLELAIKNYLTDNQDHVC